MKKSKISDLRYFDELKEYTEEIETPRFLKNIQLSTEIIDSHFHLETYSMKSKTRGVLFLVNNISFSHLEFRKGADEDRVNLITLFRKFGFIVYYFENLSAHKFNDFVQILIKSDVLKTADCLVFGVLTHGDEENHAYFSDGGIIHVEDILFKFNNRDCPYLKDKPKIFLFPFCRGQYADVGIYVNYRKAETDSSEKQINAPKMTDMLICYGSVPGKKSFG